MGVARTVDNRPSNGRPSPTLRRCAGEGEMSALHRTHRTEPGATGGTGLRPVRPGRCPGLIDCRPFRAEIREMVALSSPNGAVVLGPGASPGVSADRAVPWPNSLPRRPGRCPGLMSCRPFRAEGCARRPFGGSAPSFDGAQDKLGRCRHPPRWSVADPMLDLITGSATWQIHDC